MHHDRVERKVGGLESKVDGLIRDLAAIVGEVVREVNRDGNSKKYRAGFSSRSMG
jgi:hypothetical protein